MMGTPPSTSFLSVDNSLHKHIMIFYTHKIFYCVVKLRRLILMDVSEGFFWDVYLYVHV